MMGMMPGMMPGHLSEAAKTGAGDHAPKIFISFLKRSTEIRGSRISIDQKQLWICVKLCVKAWNVNAGSLEDPAVFW